jgi:hypothetical protein
MNQNCHTGSLVEHDELLACKAPYLSYDMAPKMFWTYNLNYQVSVTKPKLRIN